MKRNYYYLVAGLQDISLDIHKLVVGQLAFRQEWREHIHPADFALVEKLFLPYDNNNLLNLLQKKDKPHDERGNFSRERLEENIKEPANLPDYMQRFIVAFKNKDPLYPDMSPENELTTLFYDAMIAEERNDFLLSWWRFERNVRNILLALNARKYKVPFEHQVIGSGEVSDSIRRSHARDFGLGNELDYMEELTAISRKEDIREREQATDDMKWKYLDEESFFHYFTIEKILAFVIKLGMVERWLAIDRDHGNELFRKLLSELQSSYELPETFKEK